MTKQMKDFNKFLADISMMLKLDSNIYENWK